MKKLVYLLPILFVALSCENGITPIEIDHFNVQQIVDNTNSDYIQTEDFTYDDQNRLISVRRKVTSDIDFTSDGELVEFKYEGDRLIEKTHKYLPSDTAFQKTNYTYLNDGRLHQELLSYAYSGEMNVEWINEYTYNAEGQVVGKISYNPNSIDTQTSNKYFWQGDNVQKIEHYYGKTLIHESTYTYDNAFNYKRGNPYFYNYEFDIANKNNVTQVRYKDYSGLLDLACNPCSYSYEYNDRLLPIKVMSTSGFFQSLSISYAIIDSGIN
ncbi:hypothetical protein [Roseivirga misakiensis]|uniref:DUF4595 domain-containing protein n=1 Tax=Roseivirga misakiensis TaxID=1563681 RepID=A0A1E5T1C1_9BACT|nr:hypothetical protein [Roseivirga misakiensis]OEK05172.1 hypothetical protein BFP71_17330 [Roseivirga misakiensis]